jgi:hypothetical protein
MNKKYFKILNHSVHTSPQVFTKVLSKQSLDKNLV